MIYELTKLVALGEGQNLEFKQSLSSDIGRELCAFANTTGGRILIGVTDSGELKPLKNINSLVSQVQNYARNCEPVVPVSQETAGGVIIVTVEPSGAKPHASRGVFYLREGANCQKMNREQIRDFFYKEGNLYFDSQINRTFDIQKNLEARHYTRFAEVAGIPADMETGDALRNIGLLKTEGLTNAGVLLLCGNAVPFLPSATVTCALFQGTTKTKILDTKIYGEDIASNYQNALVYLKSHLNTEFIITGERENKLELPEEALREALMNALTHRDYRSGADVQVSVFSDRVEIVNPGGLVGGLNLADLGKRSIPRNPLLFGSLFRMRLVEHVGSGIKRIRDALAAENHPAPLIDADSRWFSVTFRRNEATSEKGSQKSSQKASEKTSEKASEKTSEKILSLMRQNRTITIEHLSTSIGVTERSIERNIEKLRRDGKLKRIGPDKGGQWEVLD